MDHMLEIERLSVSYGVVPALHGISFYVNEGEIVSLIGPNGAGKTTTLHAISGLLKKNKKSVFYEGADVSSIEAHKLVKKGISQVPEGRGIFTNLTVSENINLGAYLRKDKNGINKDREMVYTIFPRLLERRNAVRRRAPDAFDRTRTDGTAEAAAARRTVDGSCPDNRRRNIPDHHADKHREQHDDSAC
jgi:ABC-type branched-subunit amino acid transport system ATPase component